MDTQDLVERFRQEVAIQTHAQSLIEVYEARFGAMPAELRAAIVATSDDELLRSWLKLAATRSADDFAAAIRGVRAS